MNPGEDADTSSETLTIYLWNEEPDHPSAWPVTEPDDWPPDPE